MNCFVALRAPRNDESFALSLRDFALAKSWQSILVFLDCFGQCPRNDDEVGIKLLRHTIDSLRNDEVGNVDCFSDSLNRLAMTK